MSVTCYLENKSFHASAAGALGAGGGTNLAPARQDEGAPSPLLAPDPDPAPLVGWTLGPAPPTAANKSPKREETEG